MFRAPLCPSSGEQDRILPRMMFSTSCARCGCVELGRQLCAACDPSPHNLLSQHVSGTIMPIIRRTRPCTTAYGVQHWLCWLWLCGAGSTAVCSLRPSSTQPQPSQPVQNTTCGSTRSCSPDDGHNAARNMLR